MDDLRAICHRIWAHAGRYDQKFSRIHRANRQPNSELMGMRVPSTFAS